MNRRNPGPEITTARTGPKNDERAPNEEAHEEPHPPTTAELEDLFREGQ